LDEWFDENYKSGMEDHDFFTRCNLFGLKAKYVSNAVAYHPIKKLIYDNKEKKFYMSVRNFIYGYIKYSGIKVKFNGVVNKHWKKMRNIQIIKQS
jgi:GT2 family glycosyltransferase